MWLVNLLPVLILVCHWLMQYLLMYAICNDTVVLCYGYLQIDLI